MDTNDKIAFLNSITIDKIISKNELAELKILSQDELIEIRAKVAEVLVNIVNDDTKKILLSLIRDEEALVRTEAYDSLSEFKDQEVFELLKSAIKNEYDDLARGYAILSWVDLASVFPAKSDYIEFLVKIKNTEKSDWCKLNCCYGIYILGEKEYFNEILKFSHNPDYHLRCAAISTLSDISSKETVELITESLNQLLTTERVLAVRDRIQKTLNKIN